MGETINYYHVLGVVSTASDEEITEAYYRRAYDLHPDRHPNATHTEIVARTRAMALLNEARDTLIDGVKRQLYDDGLKGVANRALTTKRWSNGRSRTVGVPKSWERRGGPVGGIWSSVIGITLVCFFLLVLFWALSGSGVLIKLLWSAAMIAGTVMVASVWWVIKEMSR